jgi:nucleoside-diphosphate-sugar epimerase
MTLLVTGGGGFVGGAVRAALGDTPVRWLVHERRFDADDVVVADLTRRETLAGCCDGVEVVLHLASAVGTDEARCAAVNEYGTGYLLAEARRAGVRDVVYLSTAAVHGLGPHRTLDESAVPAPVSAASRTRYAAERQVLAAGGVVLRPFLTYGPGDRWFVPTVLRWLRYRPRVWVDGGRAAQSVVCVDDLARVLVAAARDPAAFGSGPLHVCEPEPVRTRDVMLALAGMYGLPRPRVGVPGGPLRCALRAAGATRLARRLELLSVEHTYRSARVWRAAGVEPGPPMLDRLGGCADWYARFTGAS